MSDFLHSLLGVDYGAKTKPTTAVCFLQDNTLYVELSPKVRDVDSWLASYIVAHAASHLFIDAPLTLPLVYFDPSDTLSTYHYRLADKQLNAMSPMFLGGLTARAIALTRGLEKEGVSCYETYPKAVYQRHFSHLNRGEEVSNAIAKELGYSIDWLHSPNAHMHDSLLCWYAGYQYIKGNSEKIGRKQEGMIYI